MVGEEGLNTSFQCSMYPSATEPLCIQLLGKSDFQSLVQIAWSSFASLYPFTCLAWAAARATLPSIAIKLLFLAGFKCLCGSAGQQALQFALGAGWYFLERQQRWYSHSSVGSQQQGSELAITKVLTWISRYCVLPVHAAS